MTDNKSFNDYLNIKLQNRHDGGLLRTLSTHDNLIDFCSNDYLGFASHAIFRRHEKENHLPSGATGSRLISGNSILAEDTEKMIASYHHAQAALIFNTGYMANIGLFSTIASKQDSFIYDEHIHASIIDGMRLSMTKRLKFKHNNPDDLEKKLKIAPGNKFIVIESLYSMDGDIAPLKEIVELSRKYHAALIVDEAHATGVFGENGKGLVCHFNLEDFVFARVHTFSKALGLHGAAVLGAEVLRSFLINYARTFIYATALPPNTYVNIRQSYKLLPEADRIGLFNMVHHFQNTVKNISGVTFINSNSPIQGIVVKDNNKAVRLAQYLQQKGFFVKAILSPTVPKGTERIRVCLHSFNTEKQIDELLKEVKLFFV